MSCTIDACWAGSRTKFTSFSPEPPDFGELYVNLPGCALIQASSSSSVFGGVGTVLVSYASSTDEPRYGMPPVPPAFTTSAGMSDNAEILLASTGCSRFAAEAL